ncbi:MAG: acetylglutamate kinase [Fimbriiglobus sp.]
MTAPVSPADVLLVAAAKARLLRGRTRVVKLGGSAMEDPGTTRGTLAAVACLQTLGVRVILVHGGGKPIDRAMAAAGLTPKKVLGRRYTDDATLRIVVKVLQELNEGLVGQLGAVGASAFGFNERESIPAAFPITGEPLTLPGDDGKPVDLGRVGKPTKVDVSALDEDEGCGFSIPVLPSLARDAAGWLNVNADTAAAAVAGALKAEACVFLTDTPGVLRDVHDPASLLAKLTRAECQQLIADGVIAGGMIPKVEACFEALDAGAGRAVILDGRNPHALLGEFLGEPSGTEIVP